MRRLVDKLPKRLLDDRGIKQLAAASRRSEISLVHLINRHDTDSAGVKDFEFSRETVDALWQAGLADVQRSVTHADCGRATEHHEGMRGFDLTR